MTAYTLYFSDPAKTTTISVLGTDVGTGVNNYSTSLDLVGSGYANYGNAHAQNFLKLLENFSSPVSPNNAIEGQLWYDTSNPNKKVLRVNNGTLTGTRWQPVSGIYQQSSDPSLDYASVVTEGDLWVDIGNTQLKVRYGTEWVIVGPNVTSGITKTGSESVFLESNTGTQFPVILNWANGKVVEIISYNNFTPRLVIDGFVTIKSGTNLTSNVNSKYNGTAENALALKTSAGAIINASEILKNKAISQTHTGTFIVESGSGLYVQNPTYNNSINLYNNANGGFVNFSNLSSSLRVGVGNNAYINFNGANSNIGINTSTTTSSPTLDVYGSFRATGITTISADSNAVSTSTGALRVSGGASFRRDVWVNGRLNVLNNTIVTGVLTVGDVSTGGITILESAKANEYDIGSLAKPFRHLFVSTIGVTGTNATVYGNVTGYANRLEVSRDFRLNGQVTATTITFNGTSNVVFATTLTRNAINDQPNALTTTATQTLLVLNTSTSTTTLEKISKNTFLSDVYARSFMSGMMVPYGSNVPPSGFLLCNGASVSRVVYPDLFAVVGTTYGSLSGSTFNLPNMSGVTTAVGGYSINYIIKT